MIHYLGPGTLWPNKIRVLIIKTKQGGDTDGKLPNGVPVCIQTVKELDPIQKKYYLYLLKERF